VNRTAAYRFQEAVQQALTGLGRAPEPESAQVDLLAKASALSPEEYIRKHSMLAAFRVAARPDACFPHDDSVVPSRKLHGVIAPRAGGFACLACIEEDVKTKGYSWFRRQHQLIGVDWCAVHGSTLHSVQHVAPFSKPPHVWRRLGLLRPLDACVETLSETAPLIQRYVAFALHHLQRSTPWSCSVLKRTLGRAAATYGLRVAALGSKPALSDHVLSLAPRKWIAQHFHGLAEKLPLAYFSRVDDLLASGTPAAGDSYILAMAALYPSVESALIELRGEGATPERNPPVRRSLGRAFWHGGIWERYLHHRGDLSALAAELEIHRGDLGQRMASIGLPHLPAIAMAPLGAAIEDFGSGMSISEACNKHDVLAEDLEDALRLGAARLIRASSGARKANSDSTYRRRRKNVFASMTDGEGHVAFHMA
jgi:hypothetical protein